MNFRNTARKTTNTGQFIISIIITLYSLASNPAIAGTNDVEKICTLTGTVIKVIDGDTITVLDSSKQQHKIRLAGIDAPEKRQPYGKAAKKELSRLIYNKQVCINWHKIGKHRRKIGTVLLNLNDINLIMVKTGYAWHYKKYQDEQTVEERTAFNTAEINARSSIIGLWQEPNPAPPWEWRHGIKQQHNIIKKIHTQQISKNNFNCGTKHFCKQMGSCAEAKFHFSRCGLTRLDGDRDGVPCESIC